MAVSIVNYQDSLCRAMGLWASKQLPCLSLLGTEPRDRLNHFTMQLYKAYRGWEVPDPPSWSLTIPALIYSCNAEISIIGEWRFWHMALSTRSLTSKARCPSGLRSTVQELNLQTVSSVSVSRKGRGFESHPCHFMFLFVCSSSFVWSSLRSQMTLLYTNKSHDSTECWQS